MGDAADDAYEMAMTQYEESLGHPSMCGLYCEHCMDEEISILEFIEDTTKEHTVPAKKHAFHSPSSSGLWLNCDEWAKHKKANPRAGNESTPASIRGNALHDVIEQQLLAFAKKQDYVLEGWIGDAEAEWNYTITDDDRDALDDAFQAVVDVAAPFGDEAQFLVEASVPLEHEPNAHGTIDFAIIVRSQNLLHVIDHKFGQGEVDPNSSQNRIYAANLIPVLEKKIGWRPTRVVLGINQPALFDEVRHFPTTADEIQNWYRGSVLETVARQNAGTYTHGAQSLEVCDKFCPFTADCAVRADLIRSAMGLVEKTALTDGEKEYLARNRAAFEKILKEVHVEVLGDADRWPNWKRWHVSNARSWDPAIGQDEIASTLRRSMEDPSAEIYQLLSPAAIKSVAPEVADEIDKLSIENGYHVRAKFGAQNEPGTEAPAKRVQKPKAPAKKASPKKATRKKAAAKKAAPKKKRAAKKPAKKRARSK